MWNRMEHFELLLQDLVQIHKQDPDIALHVTDFCTTCPAQLEDRLDELPFEARIWQISHEFCNGMGHNVCIQHISDPTALVAIIAVDLKMPPTITQDIRQHAIPGHSFYGPMIRYECQDGRLKRCTAAYALIAAGVQDIRRAGKLRQNMMWGGDKREGGEDVVFMKQLKARAHLRQHRPAHPELICRWHARDTSQTFYKSYRRYGQMPWWDLVDAEGKPVPASKRKKRKKR
jgi:hypothetical protein